MCYRGLERKISLEQGNVCFKVIGQAFHELWQFETRHVNARNLCTAFNTFYSRSSFLDYASFSQTTKRSL